MCKCYYIYIYKWKTTWRWVSRDPSSIFLGTTFTRKMSESSDYMCSFFFILENMTSSFYLKWTEFTRNCEFYSILWILPKLNWNKFTISCEFGPLQVKWWYYKFSSIKIKEYMEPEVSGIFWAKMIAKNKVLGFTRTHFTHMRVEKHADLLYSA